MSNNIRYFYGYRSANFDVCYEITITLMVPGRVSRPTLLPLLPTLFFITVSLFSYSLSVILLYAGSMRYSFYNFDLFLCVCVHARVCVSTPPKHLKHLFHTFLQFSEYLRSTRKKLITPFQFLTKVMWDTTTVAFQFIVVIMCSG